MQCASTHAFLQNILKQTSCPLSRFILYILMLHRIYILDVYKWTTIYYLISNDYRHNIT